MNILRERDGLETLILAKYCDLAELFSERESDGLPPHLIVIEIMPRGAKLPKPKMHLMTPKEMAELQAFIDKNLGKFIQPAKLRMAAPGFQGKERRVP